ncbi:MAG: type IV secretion system DNA-binding domain-containing protein [Burkholderiales bacterium]|nr:type IV secretion system DNA-binding domain-containing protein [Burkholderiales bacterium]
MAIQKSATGDLLRGSEVFWHRLTMSMRTYLMGSVAFSATALLVVFLLSEALVPTNTRAGAWAHFKAEAALMAEMPHSSIGISITDPASGKSLSENLPADQMSEVTQSAATRAEMWFALFFAIGSIAGQWVSRKLLRHQKKFGLDLSQDEFLRGGHRVEAEQLTSMVKNPSPYKIGGVPIPSAALARNILFTGGMGTGKSQAILPLMVSARQNKTKCLVYDPTGEFTEYFYRPGIDHLLNPFDSRCEAWTVFADARGEFDFGSFSTFFVPENKKSSDPVWDNAARLLIEDAFRIVYSQAPERRTMAAVRELILQELQSLAYLLQAYKLSSAGTISPANDKGAESVRLTLMSSPAIRCFDYLPVPPSEEAAFSIRRWANAEDDSWLFISSRADLHESIKPFASAWIEMALLGVMSGKRPDHQKINVLLFLDELGSLQKMRGLETALTQARKFGVMTIAGIQNIAQLEEVYGSEAATTLIANLQNKCVLRADDEKSAERYSKILGTEEIEESAESNNFGSDAGKGGINLQRQRRDRALVTMSEIQFLPDFIGFLKLSGGYPVAKVAIQRRSYEKIAPDFIPRTGLEARAITPSPVVRLNEDGEQFVVPAPEIMQRFPGAGVVPLPVDQGADDVVDEDDLPFTLPPQGDDDVDGNRSGQSGNNDAFDILGF